MSIETECAVEFWRLQAAELGLPFSVYRPAGKPICVITWQGEDSTLPSIMLNSHMDVVAVDEVSELKYFYLEKQHRYQSTPHRTQKDDSAETINK